MVADSYGGSCRERKAAVRRWWSRLRGAVDRRFRMRRTQLRRPDDSDAVITDLGSTPNFWYRTGTTQQGNVRMHLVVLEPDESRGGTVVTSVVW